VLIIGAIHERGLRSLNRRSLRDHARRRRRRMWLTYAGLAVLALSVVSPLQYWQCSISGSTCSSTSRSCWRPRPSTSPGLQSYPWCTRCRCDCDDGCFDGCSSDWMAPGPKGGRHFDVAGVRSRLLQCGDVVWMIPGIFNPIMASTDLHIGVMLSTFFLSGLLFWFQFIPSAPFRPTLSPFGQAGAYWRRTSS